MIAFVAILLLEHAIVRRLEPAHHMISEYANAGGAGGVIGTLAIAAWSSSFLACAALAWCVARNRDASVAGWRALAALLVVAGVGLGVAAVYPTQAVRGVITPGEHLRLAGRLHDLGSGIGQIALFGAAILGALLLAAHQSFRRLTIALVVIGLLLGPMLAALGAGDRGLRQRALVAGAFAWQLALIVQLDRRREPGPVMHEEATSTTS